MTAPDLTPAELDMLRGLPQRIAAQPTAGAKARALAEVARRRRLQNWGMLTVRLDAGTGVALVMITEAGAAAVAETARAGARGTASRGGAA